MKTIRCQNRVKNSKNGICGRIVAVFTDSMIELLRIDPEGGPLLRCPQCHSEQRWCTITTTNDGKAAFETVDPPKDMPKELEFDSITIYEQVS